jgi:hypothetical protein
VPGLPAGQPKASTNVSSEGEGAPCCVGPGRGEEWEGRSSSSHTPAPALAWAADTTFGVPDGEPSVAQRRPRADLEWHLSPALPQRPRRPVLSLPRRAAPQSIQNTPPSERRGWGDTAPPPGRGATVRGLESDYFSRTIPSPSDPSSLSLPPWSPLPPPLHTLPPLYDGEVER